MSLAIGAEATFVARAIDTDKKELTEVLRAAAHHKGSAFVEIYQNCNIYNDNAFDFVREQKENRLYLRHGEPIVWGDRGLRLLPDGSPEVGRRPTRGFLVHDAHAHELHAHAFHLSRLTQASIGATLLGVFRQVERPVYDELMAEQIGVAKAKGEESLRRCWVAAIRGRFSSAEGGAEPRRQRPQHGVKLAGLVSAAPTIWPRSLIAAA